MAKMTPEQEAAYAMDFGVARSDLPPNAQLAYDRLVAQRARTAATAPVSRANAEATGSPAVLPRWVAAVGTALVFLAGQGGGVVLLPYAFTRWQPGTPPWPVAVRAIGVALIAVGGPYWYVRNPLYLAMVLAVTGQALLSRPVLLAYAAVLLAAFVAFVHWYEEPTLARRFGAQYEAYRKQVPGWWPRLPRGTQ
jgi:protein-S-isoprenylcysteine O-methyltransferase Ste14